MKTTDSELPKIPPGQMIGIINENMENNTITFNFNEADWYLLKRHLWSES